MRRNSYKKSTSKANNNATTNLGLVVAASKTCVQNGWTNDLNVEILNYTRPIYRGKLKSGNPKDRPYSGNNASLASDACVVNKTYKRKIYA